MSMKSVSFSPASFREKGRSTAMRKEVTATPLGVYFNSGSVASRPIRITLFSISQPSHSSQHHANVSTSQGHPSPTPGVGTRTSLLRVRPDDNVPQNSIGDLEDAAQFRLRPWLA